MDPVIVFPVLMGLMIITTILLMIWFSKKETAYNKTEQEEVEKSVKEYNELLIKRYKEDFKKEDIIETLSFCDCNPWDICDCED